MYAIVLEPRYKTRGFSYLAPTLNVRVQPMSLPGLDSRQQKVRYSTSCAWRHHYSTAAVIAVDGAKVFSRREPPQRVAGPMFAS